MPKSRTKFTVAFKRDAEINRPATARRMHQAAEKMLAEQQAAYQARKSIGILGDDAVARTHKWAADARDVFRDAVRTPSYLHPQNFSTLLGFAREMEEVRFVSIACLIVRDHENEVQNVYFKYLFWIGCLCCLCCPDKPCRCLASKII